jgi:hypothetical protein
MIPSKVELTLFRMEGEREEKRGLGFFLTRSDPDNLICIRATAQALVHEVLGPDYIVKIERREAT